MDTDSLITVTNTEFKGQPIKFIVMEEKGDMVLKDMTLRI